MWPLLWTFNAEALEILYAPASCDPASLTLSLQNSSAQPQTVSIQTPMGLDLKTAYFSVPAQGLLELKGSSFLPVPTGFSLRLQSSTVVKAQVHCGSDSPLNLQAMTSQEVDHWLPLGSSDLQLNVMNLFLQSNIVHLQFYDEKSQIVGEKNFSIQNYYETQSLKLAVPEGARRVHLSATARISSQVVANSILGAQQSPAFILAPVALAPASDKIYFLVSNKAPATVESFVIALSDPTLIATARDQVTHPGQSKIVAASIALGNGGFNRAFAAQDKSPYTWSVGQVSSFGDFGSNDCDGDPDAVELFLNQRLKEGGRICFWQFHVVRELSLAEVTRGELKRVPIQP